MWSALGFLLVLDLSFLLKAEGIEQPGEILLLCAAADILPGIAAALGYALIRAGGLEFLMRRPSEKCIFDEESFTLEYVPEPGSREREPKNYHLIRHRTLAERAADYGGNLNLDGEYD